MFIEQICDKNTMLEDILFLSPICSISLKMDADVQNDEAT
jgi:hypothetical protein